MSALSFGLGIFGMRPVQTVRGQGNDCRRENAVATAIKNFAPLGKRAR